LGSNSPMAVNVSAYRQLPYDSFHGCACRTQ
jgi:hypothetical protein